MGAVLRVKFPSKGGHPDRSEPQLREGDRPWEGSGERNRGSMYTWSSSTRSRMLRPPGRSAPGFFVGAWDR